MPKTTVPKPLPPRRPVPLPRPVPRAEDQAWVKLCLKNEQTGGKQVCLVNHEGLEPNTGMVLVAAAVRSIEGDDKQHLLVRLPTAYSLVMPAGVQIKIDEGEPIPLQYAVCFPTSCQVQMELTKEMFEKMRKGKQMIVAAMNMQQKTMAFPVPLTGFSKTFDGPPVDNAQYEAARKRDDGEIPSAPDRARQQGCRGAAEEGCGGRSGSGRRHRRSSAWRTRRARAAPAAPPQ